MPELGNCTICGKPILMLWKDAAEKNGHSQQYTQKKNSVVVHYVCAGGKSLQQINKERKYNQKSKIKFL
jgi:putative component of toxin-antitoxin plasmid stabilization module